MNGQSEFELSKGTRDAVTFVLSDEISDAPKRTFDQVRKTLKDTLGAITAGHQMEETVPVTEYVFDTFAGSETTVLDGSGRKVGLEGAVLANAVAGNALDIDEGHLGADGHPAAIVVPAAVAVAEEQTSTIKELLEAILVGYELSVRAGRARPAITGYHAGTGSWGPIGTAAAVARLRNLSPETTGQSLAIADFNAPITPILRSIANPGSGLTKDGIGWGAYVGITAVSIAQRGLAGSGTVFDNADVLEPSTLGEEYAISDQYYKPYPGTRWIHSGIEAARELRRQHDFDPTDIKEVRVHTFKNAIRPATQQPKTADAAQYSYPFELAVALQTGDVKPRDLNAASRQNEEILALAEKVKLVHDEELEERYDEAWLSWLEIETGDDVYTSDITHPRGSEKRPLTDSDFREKMRILLDTHLGQETSHSVTETIENPSVTIDDLLKPWFS